MGSGTALACLLLAGGSCSFALNPALDASQYAHTAWKVREGFSKGTIVAIAQTPEGYLWLGTEFGVLQFDGVRSVPWEPPAGQRLPSSYIRSLLAAHDGTIWIGTAEGLASWKDGRLIVYSELAGQSISALLEDREGAVWAGGHAVPAGKLCMIRGSRVQCSGGDGRFGQDIDALYQDRQGNLWVGSATGLWRWAPGPPALISTPETARALIEGDHGAVILATYGGIRQLVDSRTEAYPLPVAAPRFTARELLRDRDGGLWIGTTDRGIVHAHQGRIDVFERSDGLSSDFIEKLFEDREGNIWAATLDGLDRFREFAVHTISTKQGLSNTTVKSVLAARDGSVWLATAGGLNRWDRHSVTIYRKQAKKQADSAEGERKSREQSASNESAIPGNPREIGAIGLPDDAIESLFQDDRDRIWVSTRFGVAYLENGRFIPVSSVPGEVKSMAGDRGGVVWISQNASLFQVRNGRTVERIPWARMGRQDPARGLVVDPVHGGLWLAFLDGGVAYFKSGQIHASYSAADGLGAGHIRDLQLDRNGALWISTEGGLSRLKDGQIITLNRRSGLPCDDVQWAMEDEDRSLWLNMACGLVRVARPEVDAWIAAAKQDPERQVKATVFDSSDGVRSHSMSTGYSPSVARSTDGKLWFLPWDGVSVIDPRHLPFNRLPPSVHIEQITADRKAYDATAAGVTKPLRLPPLVRDLEIQYAALSLVAPEKMLFRYKLENWDHDWQEAANRRQAFYGNISPGNYRFRVIASNNDGVWEETGAFLDFAIAPAYYQTVWFRLSCFAAVLAVLGGFYQMRLRRVAQQFQMRLEERVNERTRIARDLHDTLLQSFQGLLMKFWSVTQLLPERPGDARNTLETVLEQARQAINEGRHAVLGLRSPALVSNDLGLALGALGEELATDRNGQPSPDFHVRVEGAPRPLPPLVWDEVYRIGGEALRNAFQHAQARQIEVELRYDHRHLQLRVRDNGKGIDPRILARGGCDGHYGLAGMRERAAVVGGKLGISSEPESGTVAELIVPASVAYAKSSAAPE